MEQEDISYIMAANTAKEAEEIDTCTITFNDKEHRDSYNEYL